MPSGPKKTSQFFKATCNSLSSVPFRANQYKQVVQKKIDLGAIQKKIDLLHSELGQAVDEQYHAGQKDLLAGKEVSRLLETITSMKQTAKLLEEEIEQIRSERSTKDTAAATKDEPPRKSD